MTRCLASHGVDVVAAGFEGRASMLHCRGLRAIETLPDPSSHSFLGALMDLLSRHQVDMLMPCSDVALVAVTDNLAALKGIVRIAGPSPSAAGTVLDKARTYDIAQAHGIATPRSFAISDLASLHDLRADLRFPLIAKPVRVGGPAAPFKIRYFRDFAALRSAFESDAGFGRANVLQEYVEGDGLGVGALRHEGAILASFVHRRLKELPPTGGVSVLCESIEPDPEAVSAATRLLAALNWEGPALVEFRRRPDGTSVLMEVNGRYWGSIGLAIAAGVEFPWYHWQAAHGEPVTAQQSYRIGVRVRWLAGDVTRLTNIWRGIPRDALRRRSRIAETIRFIADFSPRNKSALATFEDPAPEFAEVGELVAVWLERAARAAVTRLFPRSRRRAAAQLMPLGAGPLLQYVGRTLRPRDPGRRLLDVPASSVRSILFVCSGNAMRSPFSEALLRARSDKMGVRLTVASAGIRAVQDKPAHPWAVALAPEYGVTLEGHRGLPLTQELVDGYDAIVVYDFFNEIDVLARYPQSAAKLFLLAGCDPNPNAPAEIADPDGATLEALRRCYERIAACIETLSKHLSGQAALALLQL